MTLPLDIVRRVAALVGARFPAAGGVVVGGSSATGGTTPTSDIDLLLVGPPEMLSDGRTSLAAAYEQDGRLVEVFAYTPDAYREWAERERSAHRPVILGMLADGVVLRGEAYLADLRAWAAEVVDAGPGVDPHDLDVRRYLLSALLDDLADASDPTEAAYLTAQTYEALAGFLLLAHGRWLGTGKWLVRRLREWDADVAAELGAALGAGDATAMVALADRAIAPFGGRLQAGMVR